MRNYQPAVPARSYRSFEVMRNALYSSFGFPALPDAPPMTIAEVARSDAQIRRDVTEELRSESSIDAASIGVAVNNGIVTLTGRADGDGEMWLIGSAARRIKGVESLALNLQIVAPEPGVRTDDDIGRECEHALEVTVPGPNRAVKVIVSNGWVTLTGTVDWGHERWAAEAVVSGLMGVTGVNSQIKVRPPLEMDARSPSMDHVAIKSGKRRSNSFLTTA